MNLQKALAARLTKVEFHLAEDTLKSAIYYSTFDVNKTRAFLVESQIIFIVFHKYHAFSVIHELLKHY